MQRLMAGALTLTMLLLGSWGCGPAATPEPEGPLEVTVLQGADAITMDPHRQEATPEANVLSHIHETLVFRDSNMNIVPGLAHSWELIDDHTWEFYLEENVVFHNGAAFNAEAAKFSVERAVDIGGADIQQLHLDEVVVVDEHTLRIKTDRPNPVLFTVLLSVWIVDPGHYDGLPEEDAAVDPIGTGPYVLEEWSRDERIVVHAFEDYWGGRREINTIIWKPVPEAATRVAEVEVGNADVAAHIPAESVERIEDADGVVVRTVEGGRRFYIGLRHDEPCKRPR